MVVGVLRLMSDFAETAAFLNLGLTCVLENLDYYNPLLIFWSLLLCSVSRPIQVYLFSAILNRCCSIPRPINR
jgi:NhaP-type Na+/H+ or K+/H+ antiporter